MKRGIPYSNHEDTLSLIPGAAVGEWLQAQRHLFSGRLLDLGCGNRPYAPWYAPLVDRTVWVDHDPSPGLSMRADAGALPIADDTFDTVLCTEVLEHVPDAERAVGELFRTMKSGAHVFVTVPFLYPTHEAPNDMRRFTHFGLGDLLSRHGFDVLSVETKGSLVRLLLHYVVLAVVQALGPLAHRRAISAPLAWIQMLLIRFRPTPRRIGRLSGVASLGYMALARKP